MDSLARRILKVDMLLPGAFPIYEKLEPLYICKDNNIEKPLKHERFTIPIFDVLCSVSINHIQISSSPIDIRKEIVKRLHEQIIEDENLKVYSLLETVSIFEDPNIYQEKIKMDDIYFAFNILEKRNIFPKKIVLNRKTLSQNINIFSEHFKIAFDIEIIVLNHCKDGEVFVLGRETGIMPIKQDFTITEHEDRIVAGERFGMMIGNINSITSLNTKKVKTNRKLRFISN